MGIQLKWIKRKGEDTLELFAGKWRVGKVFEDNNLNPKRLDRIAITVQLPGLAPEQGHTYTVDKAKERLSGVVRKWFLGLKDPPQLRRHLT